jgi:hypothetical protein
MKTQVRLEGGPYDGEVVEVEEDTRRYWMPPKDDRQPRGLPPVEGWIEYRRTGKADESGMPIFTTGKLM